jgi:hypothetical protein
MLHYCWPMHNNTYSMHDRYLKLWWSRLPRSQPFHYVFSPPVQTQLMLTVPHWGSGAPHPQNGVPSPRIGAHSLPRVRNTQYLWHILTNLLYSRLTTTSKTIVRGLPHLYAKKHPLCNWSEEPKIFKLIIENQSVSLKNYQRLFRYSVFTHPYHTEPISISWDNPLNIIIVLLKKNREKMSCIYWEI